MIKNTEYIAVGKFGKVRGVSGEIYIHPLTDNPDRFDSKVKFWMDDKVGYREIRFNSVAIISNRTVAKVKGIDSPEEAKLRLTNRLIFVDKDELGKAPEGKHYHFDLINCRVENENKEYIGQVVEVEEYPANDVLVIESEEGKRLMLPMVKEFIYNIDIEAKLIIAKPSGGIFGNTDED